MILDRIKQYIDAKGISISAFEKSIGMSNASFGKSLKKGGAIGTDKLENILLIYTDISPSWLLTGKGDMCKVAGDASSPDSMPGEQSTTGMTISNLSKSIVSLSDSNRFLAEQNQKLQDEVVNLRAKLSALKAEPPTGMGIIPGSTEPVSSGSDNVTL